MLESETERRGGVSEGARKTESRDRRESEQREGTGERVSREREREEREREQEEDCGWYIWERSTFAPL